MSRLTKIMLELTVINSVFAVLFLTGIVNVGDFPGLYVTFPFAAIGYGMFLICWMLEKDVTEFDAEHRALRDHAPEIHSESIESIYDHGHHEPIRV